MISRAPLLSLVFLALAACSAAPEPPPAPPPAPSAHAAAPAPSTSGSASAPAVPFNAVERLRDDAKKLEPTVQSALARKFLARVVTLPHVPTRKLYHDEKKTQVYSEREAAALPPAEKAALKTMDADEEFYYSTDFGSPLSYSRPLDVLAQRGVTLPPGSKVLDFGYGYVGHLRLLATMGIDASGVDVNPTFRALYSEPGDQGEITGPEGEKGRVRLLDGRFPSEPSIIAAVGTGYDLVISKNVLKKGYIHPDRPVDEKRLIKLGASDEVVLKSFFAALKPGGKMLVYNICPALTPPDKPFVPFSDGRSPFTPEQWQAAGFKVLVYNQDDVEAVRTMAKLLQWGYDPRWPEDKWDLDHDLSVIYTLVERPGV